MRSRAIRFGLAVCAFGAFSSLGAQDTGSELRVKLHPTDGSTVSGALVALLDSKDSVVAEGLASQEGMRVLYAPRGAYRIRVRRIGYLPFVSSELTLPRTGELVLNVESPRVVLESIVVTSTSQCSRNDQNEQALSTVWDEIAKALRSSQLTLDDLRGLGRARKYRREIAKNGNVIAGDSSEFAIRNRRPFGSIDPAALASEGYVIGDADKGWNYYGPDETVLLSDPFAATHCFRLVRERERPAQIGVSFEPTPNRKVADIKGVLWVDERTSELREINFRFVNAGPMSRFEAGGYTRFRRTPSGAWIVDEWKLSAPRLEMREAPNITAYGIAKVDRLLVVIGRLDTGGGIIGPETRQRTSP
jgi:hypothetical protein